MPETLRESIPTSPPLFCSGPTIASPVGPPGNLLEDEEASCGLPTSQSGFSYSHSISSSPRSPTSATSNQRGRAGVARGATRDLQTLKTAPLTRRPTAVRVLVTDEYRYYEPPPSLIRQSATETTPLIKTDETPDVREADAPGRLVRRAEVGLGRMVELGLPLIMCVRSSQQADRKERTRSVEKSFNFAEWDISRLSVLL